MSLKLKALGLTIVAALAVGAVSVVSAGADTGGVMHSDVEWTHLSGEREGTDEQNTLHDFTLGRTLTCDPATYTGNIATKTVGEVTIVPDFGTEGCEVIGQPTWPVEVHMNGCAFTITFTDKAEEKHHTAHLECPTTDGTTHEVTFTINPPIVGECWTHFPAQTPTSGGVALTNVKDPEKHAITANVTAEGVTVTRTSIGFAGCGHTANHNNNIAVTATAKITGFDTAGGQVNITATTAAS